MAIYFTSITQLRLQANYGIIPWNRLTLQTDFEISSPKFATVAKHGFRQHISNGYYKTTAISKVCEILHSHRVFPM